MKSQHNYNYNLQLYPTQSNIKIIQIPLRVKADGINFATPGAYKYFFDNDAELNNSIITGLSVILRFNSDNQNIDNTFNFLTITIKGKNDELLVDSLPLTNLYDTTTNNNNNNNYRSVKRFNLKPKWDKCYISCTTQFATTNFPPFIYLAVFYKPNGTTNL
jgi:hypothetical protein